MPSFKLYLVGREYDKNYYKQVVDLINRYNLSNHVEILDFDVDQNSIYNKVSFSLIPSICEGLSLTAIESQAKGIKCFASTGVPDEVSCGNIVFLELNAEVWAKQIIDCFNKTNGARSKVDLKKFSNENFKLKLESIYKKQ